MEGGSRRPAGRNTAGRLRAAGRGAASGQTPGRNGDGKYAAGRRPWRLLWLAGPASRRGGLATRSGKRASSPIMRRLWVAVSFLTRLPVFTARPFDAKDVGRA